MVIKIEPLIEQSLSEVSVTALGGVYLLYGGSGSSKTVMASTFPSPIKWIDYDDGWQSVLWAIREGICPHKKEDIDRVVPHDIFDANGNFVRATGFWQTVDIINRWIADDVIDSWSTMVIDPMTTLNRMAMHAGLEISGSLTGKSASAVKSESLAISKGAGIVIWGVQDYRPAQSLLDQVLVWSENSLKKIAKRYNKYIVLNCHVYEKYEAAKTIGGLPTLKGVEPDLMGRHRVDIVKECDEVYFLDNTGSKVKPNFQVQTIKDGFTVAKSRYGCLDVREPADFQQIQKKVKAYWEE